MSELNKLLKQFIGSNQVDGSKILLENGESLRAKKADGTEKSILKVNSSDKVEFVDDIYVGQDKLASESVVDTKILVEKQRAEAAEQVIDQKVDAEKARAELAESQLQSSITSGVAEAKTHAETKASESEVNAKSYADTKDAEKLVEAKAYTDSKISELIGGAPAATLDTIKEIADALQSEQTATGSILSQLSTLSSDVADVEGYIQNVDADVQALEVYAQSTQSSLTQEIADRQAGDASTLVSAKAYTDAKIAAIPPVDLSGYYTSTQVESKLDIERARILALEAKPAGDSYLPFTVLMTESNLAYVDLDREVKAIMSAAIGHLVAREGKDFSKSVVNGVTRITFINGFAQNGGTPVQPNQEFHCVYAYQA